MRTVSSFIFSLLPKRVLVVLTINKHLKMKGIGWRKLRASEGAKWGWRQVPKLKSSWLLRILPVLFIHISLASSRTWEIIHIQKWTNEMTHKNGSQQEEGRLEFTKQCRDKSFVRRICYWVSSSFPWEHCWIIFSVTVSLGVSIFHISSTYSWK